MKSRTPTSSVGTKSNRYPDLQPCSWSAPKLTSGNLFFLLCLLVNISAWGQSWSQGSGYRFRPLPLALKGDPGFTLMPPQETGIWFTNLLAESRSLTNTILPNGSGVAAGDIDGDGRCDIFFSGLGGGSRLYRNLGQWKFRDITLESGIDCSKLDATGAVFADVDGDGDLDLVVSSIGGGTHIFLNDGKGHFKGGGQVLNPGRGGTSLAFADTKGDGRLDLYQANYRAATIMDSPGTRFTMQMIRNKPEVVSINGKPVTDPEWTNRFEFRTTTDSNGRGRLAREELGEPDVLYRNAEHGHFEEVDWQDGTFRDELGVPLPHPPFDWGLSVMFRDFNGDGSPDLYVCNDFNSPDRFWLNDGQGHFQAAPRLALRETSFSSMGIDVADLNRDGQDDFLVVDMLSAQHRRQLTQRNSAHSEMASIAQSVDRPQLTRNTLFLNRGDGTYAEIAQYAGLDATEWSWAPIFLDVDLDGYEDLLVPNGFVRDNMNLDVQKKIKEASPALRGRPDEALALRKLFAPLTTANLAFRNLGNLRFEDVSHRWSFDATTISQGACLADLDNDGDLDVLVNNLNQAAGVYRNNASAPRIAVRLRGTPPNTQGIGARIIVRGGPLTQSQMMICGGRYLSSDEPLRVFAAGTPTNRLQIEVVWRTGKHSLVEDAPANCLYEIDETFATPASPTTLSNTAPPLFEDVSARLGHMHQDEPFDDFQRQPLLPRRLSQLGPGVAWWDLDGTGFDDLIISTGKGGQMACFKNDGRGHFNRLNQPPWNTPADRDQTAIVGWRKGTILTGNSNYEDGRTNGIGVGHYSAGQATPAEFVAAGDSSVGPLAAADCHGDGTLELFVGGRVSPGRYPVGVDSKLYRESGGKLVLDETNSAALRGLGLAVGAVWSDLDGDGLPELLVACDWGPIRIFRNDHGRLTLWDALVQLPNKNRLTTLGQLLGWWNGIAVGDFDGDGRMDIVAANWGGNTKYQRHREWPLRIFYGDFAQDNSIGILESYFDPIIKNYVPALNLDSAARGLPFVTGSFPTYESWAAASMDEVLSKTPVKGHFLEATWLETTMFLNRGDHFEARVLPLESQLSPAFGPCVADFDGDGFEDIFLSQNFFGVDSSTSRYDAGRGLLLKGDGRGNFRSVPGQESGLRIYGEQRGAAVCDFDGDGRTDLVVAQNSDETKLFRNANAKPGLRIRLEGPPGNPHAIGAVVRLKDGDHFGPARELHAGSGYWSQDSVVQVMSLAAPARQLWVRWPGGKVNTFEIPPGAREICAHATGTIDGIVK